MQMQKARDPAAISGLEVTSDLEAIPKIMEQDRKNLSL